MTSAGYICIPACRHVSMPWSTFSAKYSCIPAWHTLSMQLPQRLAQPASSQKVPHECSHSLSQPIDAFACKPDCHQDHFTNMHKALLSSSIHWLASPSIIELLNTHVHSLSKFFNILAIKHEHPHANSDIAPIGPTRYYASLGMINASPIRTCHSQIITAFSCVSVHNQAASQ